MRLFLILLCFIVTASESKLWLAGEKLDLITSDKEGFVYLQNGHFQYYFTSTKKSIYLGKNSPGVNEAAISPDETKIAFSSKNEATGKYTVTILHKDSGQVLRKSKPFYFFNSMSWKGDCSLIVASEEKAPVRTYELKICESSPSPTKWFQLASAQGKGTWLVDEKFNKRKLLFTHWAHSISKANGDLVVGTFSTGVSFLFSRKDSKIKPQNGFYNLSLSANKKSVLMNNGEKEVFLWDLSTNKIKKLGKGESPQFKGDKSYFVLTSKGIEERSL